MFGQFKCCYFVSRNKSKQWAYSNPVVEFLTCAKSRFYIRKYSHQEEITGEGGQTPYPLGIYSSEDLYKHFYCDLFYADFFFFLNNSYQKVAQASPPQKSASSGLKEHFSLDLPKL